MIDPYKKLLYRIFNIKICRKCGKQLDRKYKKRGQGRLCLQCRRKTPQPNQLNLDIKL